MKIKSIHINNFKSLVNFELVEPNTFSVFVGANGVGKSNIFEALEFLNYYYRFGVTETLNLFGVRNIANQNYLFDLDSKIKNLLEIKDLKNYSVPDSEIEFIEINISVDSVLFPLKISSGFLQVMENSLLEINYLKKTNEYIKYFENFSRIFIGNSILKKLNTSSENKLNLDCSNLEKVLKRLLSNEKIKGEITDWISLFIPSFDKIEIVSDERTGLDTLLFHEKNTKKPFTKNLISNGSYNILCLLTLVYQTDEPQFLCIEEPENGLNPYVIKELVNLFREQCKEKGHYIWLNTHSQTLVNQLTPEEIIVVNKEKNGNTVAKQFIGKDMQGMAMDTAWLTNFFGGGVPW